MPKFEVALYNRIYYTEKIEAEDEDEAMEKLWQKGVPKLPLPEGFSIGDPSAWEADW